MPSVITWMKSKEYMVQIIDVIACSSPIGLIDDAVIQVVLLKC
jgi:hypothetical protein